MTTRTVLASAIAAAVLAMATSAGAIELKYSSWTPPLAPNNRAGTIPLFAAIEKETKGTPNEMTFKNFMGAQLFNSHTTLAGIQQSVRGYATTHPNDAWIVGQGWLYTAFPGGMPTRAQLDAAVPDRPLSQQWARWFYEHPREFGKVEGIVYPNAHNQDAAYALFERAEVARDGEKRLAELEQLLGKKEVEIALLKNFMGRSD